DLHQRRGEVRLAEQHLTGAARELRLVDPAAHGGVALGIQVDEEYPALGGGERCREIDRSGGLADAALLVRDGDDAFHGPTVYFTAGSALDAPLRRDLRRPRKARKPAPPGHEPGKSGVSGHHLLPAPSEPLARHLVRDRVGRAVLAPRALEDLGEPQRD